MEPGALAPLLVVSAAVFAPTTAWMARLRRRSPAVWALFGVTLGPIGLLLAWASPPAACVACGTPTVGWLGTCEECGASVRTGLVDEGERIPAQASNEDDVEASRRPVPRSTRGTRAGRADPRLRREMARPMTGLAGLERAGAQPVGSLGSAAGDGSVASAAVGAVGATGPAVAAAAKAAAAGVAQPSTVEPEPGRRTRARAPRTSTQAVAAGPVALATGVYAGGSIGLEIGHRYTIARDDREIVILGPVETTPTDIAHRRELARIDPVGVDDRLVITGTEDDRGRYLVRFQAVAGMATEEVEQRLAAPAEPTTKKPAAARRGRTGG